MIIVTYHKETKEVISAVSIDIIFDAESEVELEIQTGIVKEGYDCIIYSGTEPLFKDDNGVVKLEENKLLLCSDYLEN